MIETAWWPPVPARRDGECVAAPAGGGSEDPKKAKSATVNMEKRRSWLQALVDSEEEEGVGGSEQRGRRSPECVKVVVGAAENSLTEIKTQVESKYVYVLMVWRHSSGSVLNGLCLRLR